MNVAFLRRERLYTRDADGYEVQVGEMMTPDDGLRIDMGPVTGAWYDVPLPSCPDCGADLMWFEAGYVPGPRQCAGCGSLFSVQTERAKTLTKAEIFWDMSAGKDEGWAWRVEFDDDVTTQESGPWGFVVIDIADCVVDLAWQHGTRIDSDEVAIDESYGIWTRPSERENDAT